VTAVASPLLLVHQGRTLAALGGYAYAVGGDSLREVIAFSPASPVRSTRTQPERTRTENQG